MYCMDKVISKLKEQFSQSLRTGNVAHIEVANGIQIFLLTIVYGLAHINKNHLHHAFCNCLVARKKYIHTTKKI